MSADPAVIPEARPIERLCFADAEELGHLGARIIHPDAVAPAVRAGVEVRVRFVKDPSHPGTVLIKEELGLGTVAVVATVHEARDAVALVGANNVESGALARRALEGRGLSADWTGKSKSGRALFLGVKSGEVIEALRAVHRALFESGL